MCHTGTCGQGMNHKKLPTTPCKSIWPREKANLYEWNLLNEILTKFNLSWILSANAYLELSNTFVYFKTWIHLRTAQTIERVSLLLLVNYILTYTNSLKWDPNRVPSKLNDDANWNLVKETLIRSTPFLFCIYWESFSRMQFYSTTIEAAEGCYSC